MEFRQIDKLEAEDAVLAIENCAHVLHALVCASDDMSDEARNGSLDLVADTLKRRSADFAELP